MSLLSRVAGIRLASAHLHKSVPLRGLMVALFTRTPFSVLLTRYLGFGVSESLDQDITLFYLVLRSDYGLARFSMRTI